MSSLSNFWLRKSHYDNDLNFALPQVYMPNFNRLKVNILKIYCTVLLTFTTKERIRWG